MDLTLREQNLTWDSIIVDTRISSYIFNNLKHFIIYSNLSLPLSISSSNNSNTIATSTSTIAFTTLILTSQKNNFELVNTLYLLLALVNILSVGQFCDNGIVIDGFIDSLC